MAGSAPTLTINSFSSPNSANGIAPTTGVLLQEYHSPTGATVTVNGSSCLTNTSSSTSSVVVHGSGSGGGGGGGSSSQTTVQATATTKKREAFLSSQGQPVKLENKSNRTPCLCRNSNGTLRPFSLDFSA